MAAAIVIAQGGGPTAVINQTLAGAVVEARRLYPDARILGARYGVRGIRDRDFVDLGEVTQDRLMRIAAMPSAALGSTRDKPDQAYCAEILAGLRAIETKAFIHIGGNDTSETQQILADASNGGIAFIHAPKTIDNDLMENDHTPGFISAAEFVAGAFLSVDLDFRALPGIYVGIVMGRHAGFLTAASAAWRIDEESGPHLIYVPERAFDPRRFVDDIKATLGRHRRCIVAMSEGVTGVDGRPLVESIMPADRLERDAHGNVRLSGTTLASAIESILADGLPGMRARVDTFGYLPRGNVATVSGVDAREAFEAGRLAAASIEAGKGSVALQFDGASTVMRLVPLEAVAGKTRHMPEDFLLPEMAGLSASGLAYLDRLVPRHLTAEKPFV